VATDRKPPEDQPLPSWKDRYVELEARLADSKTTLKETRNALTAASEREQEVRARLAKVRERLEWHERALLRPEVLAALMPARAAWRKRTPPDEAAVERESTHTRLSPSYAAARHEHPPEGAEQVEIDGVTWWVPRDGRKAGQLADRLLVGKQLPFVDLLRTREAISNGIMLDIGANIGLTSVLRAILGDASVVYAAEPAPDNFACLVHTIVDNGLSGTVLPDRVAISDQNGTATLRLAESIGGHALLKTDAGVAVTTVTLDTWVSRLGIDADAVRYVKMDTQGHEDHVLAGAPLLLSRPGIAWELEFSPRHLQKAGRDPAALLARMRDVFTHFIDLNPHAPGDRIRPTTEIAEALSYLDRSFTNLLAYRAPTA
jgi:FkbM family methyltransferase